MSCSSLEESYAPLLSPLPLSLSLKTIYYLCLHTCIHSKEKSLDLSGLHLIVSKL